MTIYNQLKEKTLNGEMIMLRASKPIYLDSIENVIQAGISLKNLRIKNDSDVYIQRNSIIQAALDKDEKLVVRLGMGNYYILNDLNVLEDLENCFEVINIDIKDKRIFEVGDLIKDSKYGDTYFVIRYRNSYVAKSLEDGKYGFHGSYPTLKDFTIAFYHKELDKCTEVYEVGTFKLNIEKI